MPTDPRVLVGSATADDAGVVKLRDDLALVQTVDFFPPMVDDPFGFGRVGASNSISDVYAMGGTPVSAVCVYALPDGLPEWVPPTILEGAVSTCVEADVPLVGGHTVKDKEIKFGLCVTGVVHPDHIVTNSGAQVGDKLVLTKPIGSGYLCTAIKRGILSDEEAQAVVDVMAALNRDAGEAMVAVNANAGTDITGFGVLGHTLEMARSAGVTIRLESGAVPWMEGLSDHVNKKNTCGGLTRNLEYAKQYVTFEGGTAEQQSVLADPQTSGGLLISVPEARVDALLRDLEARGVETRAVVGEVVARGEHDVVVL